MSDDLVKVAVSEGKYTFGQRKDGSCYALRHGEPWREGIFDGMTLAMAYRIEELEAKLSESEALLAKAVEALEWQADAIHNATTVNMKRNHRILLDGIYHEGPLVDWVHKILTGFETINRSTLAELRGETE